MAWQAFFPTRCEGDALQCTDVLRFGLEQHPRKVFCLTQDGDVVRFEDLAREIGATQSWLRTLGLRPGDRVGVMMANNVSHIALIFALMLSRMIWVPINTRLKELGLRHIVECTNLRLLIADAEMEEAFAGVQTLVAIVSAKSRPGLQDDCTTIHAHEGDPTDTLALIYTSGTTGAPKGVVFTHRMLRIAAEAAIIVADARNGDRMVLWEPLCHIGGAQLLLLPFMIDVELHVVTRFSASSFWRDLASARATHVHYLGGILDMLAQQPRDAAALSSLRVFWGAGATPAAWDFVNRTFGIRLRECYGMTECSSFATVNTRGTAMSIGTPLPWIDIQLRDTDGRVVVDGEVGEIILHSALEGALAASYLDNATATDAAMRGGSLHTGDLARRDPHGMFYFVGRRSENMRVRGENVSAWEVERVFADHPAIELTAAVGVRSPLGEEDILLYVKAKAGATLDLSTLRDWGARLLASYQVPRYYRRVESFVTTPSERIRKQFLSRDLEGALDSLSGRRKMSKSI